MQEVILSVTSRCNLKCAMCDIPLSKTEEVSTAALSRTLDDLKLLKPHSVVFSGGEPLLRDDIYRLIYKAHENGFRTCLTTNGILVDKDVAVKLKKAGLDIANVSIEGNKETHEAIRGTGSYEKACDALKFLWEVGVETTIAMCVSKKNYMYMEDMLSLATKTGATTVKYQAYSTLFTSDKRGEGFYIDDKNDTKKLRKQIKAVIKKSSELKINVNPHSYLKQLPIFLSPDEELTESVKYGCRSLYDVASVTAEGNLIPCFMLPQWIIGNLEHDRINTLWNGEKHKETRADIEAKGCKGCLLSCYEDDFKPFSLKAFIKKIILKLCKPFVKKQNRHQGKLKEIAFCKKRIESKLKTR